MNKDLLTLEELQGLLSTHRLPGLIVATAQGDREKILAAGSARLEPPVPLLANTLFPVGSLSKTLTATLCALLWERGLFDLDAPVRDLLPEFQASENGGWGAFSVRALLTHTAGLVSVPDAPRPPAAATLAQAMSLVVTGTRPGPTSGYHYSDAGHIVAGRVIEVLTGQPFGAAARALVLEPLGLHGAGFLHEFAADDPRLTLGYTKTLDGRLQPYAGTLHGPYLAPTGGLCLSATHLLAYLRFFLRNGVTAEGTRLIGPAALELLLTPQLRVGPGEAMTLAWAIREEWGRPVFTQRCNFAGIVGAALFMPEQAWAGAVFNNALHGLRAQVQLTQRLLAEGS